MNLDDNIFGAHLLSGEHVKWSGRPGRGILFTGQDVFLVPFSLIWCGFAVFWTITATGQRTPSFFTLWGLMFVAIGLYFVFGRFLVDAWLRRGIRYAVTDRRILIARQGPFSKFTAVGLDQLPAVDLSEQTNGRGTIHFGAPAPMWGNRNMGGWSPALDPTPQFLAIEDARSVFDLIQQSARR